MMLRIEALPEGIQCRFAVYDGKRLVAVFVRYNEAHAYMTMKKRAMEKVT